MNKHILLLLFMANIGSFAWSVIGVFNTYTEQKNRSYHALKVLSILAYAGGVGAIFAAETFFPLQTLVASALLLISLSLFWYAAGTTAQSKFTLAFSQDTPSKLVRFGPYRHLRNPFYTSYILAYFAVWILTMAHWFLLILIPIIAIYVKAAREEEQKFLSSPLAEEYKIYLSQSGRFLPRFYISTAKSERKDRA